MRNRSLLKLAVIALLIGGASAAVLFLRDARQCHSPVCPAADGSRIAAIEASAELKPDGTIEVNERITWFFDRPTHGLHRDIPAVFETLNGDIRVPVVVRTVRDKDNVVINHQDEVSGSSLRVWIADPATAYEGEQTFQLTYIMNGGVWRGNTHDFFLWDVIGPDQGVPVENISAQIVAPNAAEDAVITCNTGPESCAIQRIKDGAMFEAKGEMYVAFSALFGKLTVLPAQQFSSVGARLPYLPFALPLLMFVVLTWRWLRQDAHGPRPLSLWRLLLVLPLAALPFAFQEVMTRVPRFVVPGSGPNAVAAIALCIAEICVFGLLALLTAPRGAASPPTESPLPKP